MATQPVHDVADRQPDSPTDLSRRSWWSVLKRTGKQFQEDNLSDWAAALTYYAILSIFPGLLVLVSGLGLFGRSTVQSMVDNIGQLTPGAARQILTDAVNNLQHAKGAAGVLAIVGLVGALWSASGYIAAFVRAANAIFDVPEGRPIWKTLPLRLGLTLVTGVLLAITVLAVVFTGRFAEQIGKVFGIGSVAVTVWDVAKWPVLVLAIGLLFALLYWASPNARPGGFKWITPGSALAVFVWLVVSGGFAFYVANFGSYNKVYGTLGTVIIFLVWLWLSNLAVLLGVEFDAELARQRAIEGGQPPDAEPYLPLRDDRKVDRSDQPAEQGLR
jgi:membrane protein